jgi:ADP-ribosylglycohydrolase
MPEATPFILSSLLQGIEVSQAAAQASAAAILFGLALGDALGYPTEFLKLHQIRQRYGPDGIQEPPDPALYSDDTQMTLALTEAILEVGTDAPLEQLMNAVGEHFRQWAHSPENNRAPGNTCMTGIRHYEQGMDWSVAGLIESKGCGSAMRVATLGYFYQHDPERLKTVAIASSQITHRHPTALAATAAAAYGVKLALDGVSAEEYLPQLLTFLEGVEQSDEMTYALLRIGHVLGWTNEEAALEHLGQGWTGEEAVALALYCVLRYPDDYVACVRRAANTNGDSDSIACIAGGMMGARLGLTAIPENWQERCENRQHLLELSWRMAQIDVRGD